MTDFESDLSDLVQSAFDHNNAFGKGIGETLIGRTVIAATGEVWSGDGEWSITLFFNDGSAVTAPGETHATGPLADIVRMAGGNPGPQDKGE